MQVSILDAQRRTRQRVDASPAPSLDRSAWRAGRTPFQPALSRMGGAGRLQVQLGEGLLAPPVGRPITAPPAGVGGRASALGGPAPKSTTETARRILATLDALDQAAAGGAAGPLADEGGGGGPRAGREQAPAASPPPTDSLGFAGAAAACRLLCSAGCCASLLCSSLAGHGAAPASPGSRPWEWPRHLGLCPAPCPDLPRALAAPVHLQASPRAATPCLEQ